MTKSLDALNDSIHGVTGMAYRTIVVSLNDVARVEAMVGSAALIAETCNAHLIGCYVIPAVKIYPEVGFAAASAIDDSWQQYFKENAPSVRVRFEEKLRQSGVSGEFRVVNSRYTEWAPSLVEHGRLADLIIVSQTARNLATHVEPGFVESVVMDSGRPVLIIPDKAVFAGVKSAVIGFNATREAARTLFDAMPLLQNATDVRIIWVDPYRDRDAAGEVPGAEAAVSLARHGVKATAEGLTAGGGNAGEALLQRANDLGSELLVMGAFAHSRMREYIFGGATQHVLAHANIPVLMSH